MLKQQLSPSFERDVKRLKKKHVDTDLLKEVVLLIVQNDEASKRLLRSRHRMHALKGAWSGSLECHVANFGDWLLVWCVKGDTAIFQRTGTHDELFK